MNFSFLNPSLLEASPYPVADSDGFIKLDAMELPFTLPPAQAQGLAEVLAKVPVNRYPDPSYRALKQAIADSINLPAGLSLLLGNGSDELIQILLLACQNGAVMSPDPSFVVYQQWAQYCNKPYIGFNLNPDFSIDAEGFIAAVKQEQPALIFLASPNNPTGFLLPKDFIRAVIEAADGLVVIDEAYSAYARENALDLLTAYDNVVMIRTLSKIGMAGIRLGYLIAKDALVERIDCIRMPYNINRLTEAAALYLLSEPEIIREHVTIILQQKQRLFDALQAIADCTVYPSETNFLLLQSPHANALYADLKANKILVKNLHNAHPLLQNTLRLTVSDEAETSALINAIKAFFAKQ